MKCLILSDGPVPAPEQAILEGGGLRCWGLAKGIVANNGGISVTVAYNESYRKDPFTAEHEGIVIGTYTEHSIASLVHEFDTVIVSYCMGTLSVVVAESVRPDQQLILDCYVPIYVEASARDSADREGEYRSFETDVDRLSRVLRRGDLFLCASQTQKQFYLGVLSGLGRINPLTYGEDLIIVVPFGIYRNSPEQGKRAIESEEGVKNILWFGGLYPWFDITTLIEAVGVLNKKLPAKLVIVGAKNPFNNHPDFDGKYQEMLSFIRAHGLENEVVVQDWVPFSERADWYLDSDLTVVVNKPGLENSLAWRTRIVDFVWAGLPIISSGGDPVSEMLFAADAAEKFKALDSEGIADDLERLLQDPKKMARIRDNLARARESLYWDIVTEQLTSAIKNHIKAADQRGWELASALVESKANKATRKLRRVSSYLSEHGFAPTVKRISQEVRLRTRARNSTLQTSSKRIIFVSHRLDTSGAPFVLVDLVRAVKSAMPGANLEFLTYRPLSGENVSALNSLGIKPRVIEDRNASIPFSPGDVVLLNTTAFRQNPLDAVLAATRSGKISKLLWYVHEDEPQLLFRPADASLMRDLLRDGRLEIWSVAKKTTENYRSFFGPQGIFLQPYRLEVPSSMHQVYAVSDFDDLRFILSGTMVDGRKGQLPILYAFLEFNRRFYISSPERYRDFEMQFVGVGDDFLSRQIRAHGEDLGSHLKLVGKVSREESLALIKAANISICYSLRESLPMSIFEGMIAGHPLLRNDCSGLEEQLKEGQNGFLLPSSNFEGLVGVIERILSREKTSNEQLASMSQESFRIAKRQEGQSYSALIQSLQSAYKTSGRQ
ncbi:MAG TPA: glycosyltransferase family 4 protein [Fimbriimonadaceae bacterium]